MQLSLSVRVTTALLIIVITGIGLTVALNIYKFEKTLAESLQARFVFVLQDIKHVLESGMGLGLPLAELANSRELLESNAARDPNILSIEVFDQSGTVLFSTDTSFEGDLVSQEWLRRWSAAQDRDQWTLIEQDARVVGIPLRNALGQNAGSLALRYSRTSFNATVEDVANRLMLSGAVIVALVAVIGLVGTMLLLRRSRTRLLTIAKALDDLRQEDKPSPAIEKAGKDSAVFKAFASSTQSARRQMQTASADFHRLDEEELA